MKSAELIITKLKKEKCFDSNNRLAVWPNWLTAEMFKKIEPQLRRVFYENCYCHTNWYYDK